MSGHNKWSKIKRQKEVSDTKRSKIFSKHVRTLQNESRRSKGNIEDPGLRTAIEAAKRDNMPKENIERAIAKGNSQGGAGVEPITYEGYGPGGVALIIEVLTDSRNRAAAEIRHILSKNNGAIAEIGAASWAFTKQDDEWIPQTTIEIEGEDREKLEQLIEALEESDDVQGVFTNVL
jgi:YebC/PmpR family DNA-binding regulatory protein